MIGPALSVIAAGLLSAAVARWTFSRFSDRAKVGAAKREIKASLYEMRLFVDEPRVLLRAQTQLLRANLRYLRLMLPPAMILTAPMFLVMTWLDGAYGSRALHPGEAALLTVYVQPSVDLREVEPSVEGAHGITVETPPVRIVGEHRFLCRIRPIHAGSGSVRVLLHDGVYEKSVGVDGGSGWVSRERVHSVFAWILNPAEPRLPPGEIERIEVDYPGARISAFGITLPWLVWFLAAAAAGALCLR